tara:strand:- start:381 stop:1079 length:699 start_codon:yes stop_codon:yes gene_type:complete
MAAQLHQLTLTFDPIEDRILLRIGTAENTEYRLWLTRRFVKVLWKALMKNLDQTLEFEEPRVPMDKKKSEDTVDTDKNNGDPEQVRDTGKTRSEGGKNGEAEKSSIRANAEESAFKQSTQVVRNKVKAVEHKQAIQSSDFSQKHAKGNVNLTSESGPLLVVGCRVKALNEETTHLSLKTKDGMGIQFGLNKKLLYALCHMMTSSSKKAEWDLELEIGDPKVFSPEIPEGVVH